MKHLALKKDLLWKIIQLRIRLDHGTVLVVLSGWQLRGCLFCGAPMWLMICRENGWPGGEYKRWQLWTLLWTFYVQSECYRGGNLVYSLSPCKLVGYVHLGVLCDLFHNLQMSAFANLSSCGWILEFSKKTRDIQHCLLLPCDSRIYSQYMEQILQFIG
jgi:hypothetical protein